MRITSTIGANSVVHNGDVYEADADGTFDVPETVGRELTGFPVWLEEWQALDLARAAQREVDTDADRQAARIKALEDQVAELRELLPKRRTRRAKAEAVDDEPADEPEDDDSTPDE